MQRSTPHLDEQSSGEGRVNRVQLSERLREIRDLRGMTQEQVAEELGVSEGTYRHWEAGRIVPLMDEAPRVAHALRVSLNELFGATNSPVLDPEEALDSELLRAHELTKEDREHLVAILDSLIIRHRVRCKLEDKSRGRPPRAERIARATKKLKQAIAESEQLEASGVVTPAPATLRLKAQA